MSASPSSFVASTTQTRFAPLAGRTLAYREQGEGTPILLANRFRGTLDTWDPAFLDALAAHHRVITFEYAGLSSSTGTQATTHLEMAEDLHDLASYLGLERYAVGGWSLGGMVAQVAITEKAEWRARVTHGVIIGSRAPAADPRPLSPRFLERALKPENDLADEEVLFFNPAYDDSRRAAAASHERLALRTEGRSAPLTQAQWLQMIQIREFAENSLSTFEKMRAAELPVLALLGENDLSCPADVWLAHHGELPAVQMVLLPRTGHAPHHQLPELAADYLAAILRQERR